jgi:uncharacterized protein (TIGR02147 family)
MPAKPSVSQRKPKPPKEPALTPAGVYAYRDYKALVRDLITAQGNGGRGVRRLLAEALRCQVAYISHVLAGHYHFSAEQAEGCARFFGLPKEETEFFLLLVSENRAATPELRALYQRMLEERRAADRQLQSRTKISQTLGREEQATYYSHWYYAAVHMLLTIPAFRTPEAIRRHLGLSPKLVQEVLKFLTLTGLARQENKTYLPGSALLHLERDSPLIARHHANWRLAAIEALGDEAPHDLHYSGVVSCSAEALPEVRARIAKCLEECMDVIKPSAEERLAAICLDWFEV